uniref:Uncharacterized protein n=1 Tax=Tanacetum cinerariifolium TaxID=118510 RepID=A0A6L2MXP2_TANCI|nr:hypothetical protein [Tanacetum cinerariifolium]
MKKAFQVMLHELGEVNPTHAYCNGFRTSKDNEDPSWNTSLRPRELRRQLQLWKRFGRLHLIVFLLVRNIIKICENDMCYINTLDPLVVAGNQPNSSAGIQEHFDAGKIEEGNVQQYMLLPLWSTGLKDPQNAYADVTFEVKEFKFEVHVSPSSSDKIKKHDEKSKSEAKRKSPVEIYTGVKDLNSKFKEFTVNSTNGILITAVGPNSTKNTNSCSVAV